MTYGLEFMGKEWDRLDLWRTDETRERTTGRQSTSPLSGKPRFGSDPLAMQTWHESWAREAYRVMKTGAHLVAFGGTRTHHRLICAIEDAGFEIRDCLSWLYGSGFPKSHNLPGGLGTALKPAWEPIVLARKPLIGTVAANVERHGTGALNVDACRLGTDESTARSCNGIGRSTSFNMAASGEPRINGGSPLGRWPANVVLDEDAAAMLDAQTGNRPGMRSQRDLKDTPSAYFGAHKHAGERDGYNDSGGPSRFFYTAKSSRAERNAGLGSTCTVKYTFSSKEKELCAATVHLLEKATSDIPTVRWHIGESGASITAQCPRDSLSTTLTAIRRITLSTISPSLTHSPTNGFIAGVSCEMASGGNLAVSAESSSEPIPTSTSARTASPQNVSSAVSSVLSLISDGDAWKPDTNFHPTCKPVDLMRWLVRLVTPPAGIVLDPFMGSGTTGIACVFEERSFIGIEREAEYVGIALRRIERAQGPMFAAVEVD